MRKQVKGDMFEIAWLVSSWLPRTWVLLHECFWWFSLSLFLKTSVQMPDIFSKCCIYSVQKFQNGGPEAVSSIHCWFSLLAIKIEMCFLKSRDIFIKIKNPRFSWKYRKLWNIKRAIIRSQVSCPLQITQVPVLPQLCLFAHESGTNKSDLIALWD